MASRWRAQAAHGLRPTHIWVGVSGGVDSMVLLHMTKAWADTWGAHVGAVHVDHGWSPDAAKWALHVQEVCRALDVPVHVHRVEAPAVEALARDRRYTVFAGYLQSPTHVLLLGHQADDEAETLLLRLCRGAGLQGLCGIPPMRACGRGWLWRPLLGVARCALEQAARAHGMVWCRDPSNQSRQHRRNVIRWDVLAPLEERIPHLKRVLCGVTSQLRDTLSAHRELVQACIAPALQHQGGCLVWPDVAHNTRAVREAVLHHWITEVWHCPAPSQGAVKEWVRQLEQGGSRAAVRWPVRGWHRAVEGVIRAYRGCLHWVPYPEPRPVDPTPVWPWSEHEVVRFSPPAGHARTLKKRFQTWGVPPWLRGCIPLLYRDHTLVGVWMGEKGFKRL